jgi:hypothetical protein
MDRPSWNNTLYATFASCVPCLTCGASSRSSPNTYNGSDLDDEYTNNDVLHSTATPSAKRSAKKRRGSRSGTAPGASTDDLRGSHLPSCRRSSSGRRSSSSSAGPALPLEWRNNPWVVSEYRCILFLAFPFHFRASLPSSLLAPSRFFDESYRLSRSPLRLRLECALHPPDLT